MAVEGTFTHKSPEFIVHYSVDKSTKKCKIKVTKSNTSMYGYKFSARIRSGDKTVCEVNLSESDMNGKTYTMKWEEGTATGSSAKIQVKCFDNNCTSNWGDGKYHTKKTISLTTTTDTYNNNPAGDFTIYYNTTNSIKLWVTQATIATITKTVTSGSGTTTTTRNAEGAEFIVTINSSQITSFEQEVMTFTVCNGEDKDFSIGPNGEWLTGFNTVLSPYTGYCFQLWYTDDYIDDYKCLTTHYFATSCMPTLSASAGTSTINIKASSGYYNTYNKDFISNIKVIVNQSYTASVSDFDGILATDQNIDHETKYETTLYNYDYDEVNKNNTYYVHMVKCDSSGNCDANTITTVKVVIGYVAITNISNGDSRINGAYVKFNVTGKIYNASNADYNNGNVSTANTDYYYTFDSPYDNNINPNWVYIGGGTTSGEISAFIPLPAPHMKNKTVYILYRELNTARNAVLSQSITQINIASSVNVVKIGNKWAIPKIYNGSQWKYAKAKIYINGAWHDTKEAYYNYTLGKWEV